MNPRLRPVMVLASTAAACAAVLGASDPSRPEAVGADPTPAIRQEVTVTVTTERSTYRTGDPVRGRITVVNRGDADVRLLFSSSQRFDFEVRNAGGEAVWRWSALMAFAQVLGAEVLSPGDSLRYEAPLDADLAPGSYSVVGSLVARNMPLQGSAAFTVQ